jgi:hypothetical protein
VKIDEEVRVFAIADFLHSFFSEVVLNGGSYFAAQDIVFCIIIAIAGDGLAARDIVARCDRA